MFDAIIINVVILLFAVSVYFLNRKPAKPSARVAETTLPQVSNDDLRALLLANTYFEPAVQRQKARIIRERKKAAEIDEHLRAMRTLQVSVFSGGEKCLGYCTCAYGRDIHRNLIGLLQAIVFASIDLQAWRADEYELTDLERDTTEAVRQEICRYYDDAEIKRLLFHLEQELSDDVRQQVIAEMTILAMPYIERLRDIAQSHLAAEQKRATEEAERKAKAKREADDAHQAQLKRDADLQKLNDSAALRAIGKPPLINPKH